MARRGALGQHRAAPARRDLHDALRSDGAPPLYYVLLHVWTGAVRLGRRRGALAVGRVHDRRRRSRLWFAARRFAGTAGAWIAVDARWSRTRTRSGTRPRRACTRSRCCSSRAGILAFQRALEQPTIGPARAVRRARRAARCTRSTGRSTCSRSSWCAARLAARGAARTAHAARRMLRRDGARRPRVRAVAADVPVPARAHRHAVGHRRCCPGIPLGYTLRDFAGGDQQAGRLPGGGCCSSSCCRCCCSACSAAATDDRRVELDLHTQPGARWEAFVGGADARRRPDAQLPRGRRVPVALQRDRLPVLRRCSSRAASRRFADPRVRAGVLVVVLGLGFVGRRPQRRARNRTQAGEVAAVLRAEAQPGDVVVYCPDQLGPRCTGSRRRARRGRRIPSVRARPAFVDWVDYKKRLARGRSRGVRAGRARAGRRPHALVRERARLHHAPGRVPGAVDAVRDRARPRDRASRPTSGSSSTRGCRSSRPPGRRTADRTWRPGRASTRWTSDVRVRAVLVPYVLSRADRASRRWC